MAGLTVLAMAAGFALQTIGARLTVKTRAGDGTQGSFDVVLRIDTPEEMNYYRHGGILHYVLRQLVRRIRAGRLAEALEVSPATVKRDWTVARAWLFRELGGG